jgi:hypothetical protein
MSRSAYFQLTDSEFNKFLFAPVCDEQNGMPLNVVSVLARAGTDPWAEASRLAGLPRAAATKALAAMIARGPVASLTPSETSTVAARLIELLPMLGRTQPKDAARLPQRQGSVPRLWSWLIILGLMGIAILSVMNDRGSNSGALRLPSAVQGTHGP